MLTAATFVQRWIIAVGKYRWPYLSLSCFHLPVYLLPAHFRRPSVRCRTHHYVTLKVAVHAVCTRASHLVFVYTMFVLSTFSYNTRVYTSTSGLTGSAGLGLGISANVRCDFYQLIAWCNATFVCAITSPEFGSQRVIVSLRLRGLTVKLDW